jgi:hypothetical protein
MARRRVQCQFLVCFAVNSCITCANILAVQGKTVKLISGGDIIKMLAEQKKMEALQKKKIEEKAVSMKVPNHVGGAAAVAGAVKPAEGVVGGAVEIAPVPGVPNDAVGGRGFANGTSSPLMMPPPKFPVASSTVVFRQNSMISKKLCEITQFPEFAMKSTHTVHFRERDDKVSFPDLSVRMGVYKTISEAHRATLQLIEKKDSMVNDLDSLEIDDKLLIMAGKSVILMSFPDAIKLLHGLDVRTSDAVQDVIMAQTEVVVASEAAQDIIMAQAEVSAASDAVQDIIMAQVAMPVASEAVQDVIMAQTEVAVASEAAQDIIMAQAEVSAASEAVQDVIMAQVAMPVASEAVQDVIMPQAEVSAASDAVPDVIKPQVKATAAFDAARPVAAKIRMRKVQASVLKTISGIEHLDDCPHGKELRQIEQGEIGAKGQDISGMWNLQDVGAVYLYDDTNNANRWAKGFTTADASSLIKIPSGNPSVS